jgi:hypothetical protein
MTTALAAALLLVERRVLSKEVLCVKFDWLRRCDDDDVEARFVSFLLFALQV